MRKTKLIPASMFLVSVVFIFIYGCGPENNKTKPELEWSDSTQGCFIDKRDNHKYKVVKIGNQVWMSENFAYRPVVDIVVVDQTVKTISTANYCMYNNDSTTISKYGYLYDWETAKTSAPEGWHLPSDSDWVELAGFYNTEIFSPCPAGFIFSNGVWTLKPASGSFSDSGLNAGYWTATEYENLYAHYRYTYKEDLKSRSMGFRKENYLTVRYLLD